MPTPPRSHTVWRFDVPTTVFRSPVRSSKSPKPRESLVAVPRRLVGPVESGSELPVSDRRSDGRSPELCVRRPTAPPSCVPRVLCPPRCVPPRCVPPRCVPPRCDLRAAILRVAPDLRLASPALRSPALRRASPALRSPSSPSSPRLVLPRGGAFPVVLAFPALVPVVVLPELLVPVVDPPRSSDPAITVSRIPPDLETTDPVVGGGPDGPARAPQPSPVQPAAERPGRARRRVGGAPAIVDRRRPPPGAVPGSAVRLRASTRIPRQPIGAPTTRLPERIRVARCPAGREAFSPAKVMVPVVTVAVPDCR